MLLKKYTHPSRYLPFASYEIFELNCKTMFHKVVMRQYIWLCDKRKCVFAFAWNKQSNKLCWVHTKNVVKILPIADFLYLLYAFVNFMVLSWNFLHELKTLHTLYTVRYTNDSLCANYSYYSWVYDQKETYV